MLPAGQRIINVSGWEDRDKEGGYYRDYFRSPACYHVSNYPGDSARGANAPSDVYIEFAPKEWTPDMQGRIGL